MHGVQDRKWDSSNSRARWGPHTPPGSAGIYLTPISNHPKVDFLRVLFSVHFYDPLFLVAGGSRSGPNRVKVPPWRSLGGSLAAFGRIWHAFGVHFEGHFWFNFHHFSARPKTLFLNDLTVLFDVFALLKALLFGSFLDSFSVPISDPLQKRFLAPPEPPRGAHKCPY